jgi:hypothetical protein
MALQVSQITTLTSADIRSQLANSGTDQGILVSFVERIQLDMLRTSNWTFLLSAAKQFVTQTGVTDYWIGKAGTNPAGSVDTGLNITDLKRIDETSVFDRSNFTQLNKIDYKPESSNLNFGDNTSRTERPKAWVEDPSAPYLLRIFPAPNNQNGYRPVPEAPICTTTVSGALAARIYWVNVTFVDALGNESTAAPTPTKVFVPANSVLVVQAPVPGTAVSASGVAYNRYNVYAVSAGTNTSSSGYGPLTLQNVSFNSTASPWQEPNTGLTTLGSQVPSNNAITPLDGYVIEFKYWQQRPVGLTAGSTLLIPDEYKDVVIAGTNMLAAQFLNKQSDLQYWSGLYQSGLRTMIRDRNLSPKTDFVKPDSAANTFGNSFLPY